LPSNSLGFAPRAYEDRALSRLSQGGKPVAQSTLQWKKKFASEKFGADKFISYHVRSMFANTPPLSEPS